MKTGQAKHDEILDTGRPVGLKTSLGYIGDSHIKYSADDVKRHENLEGVFTKANMTNDDRKKLINKYKLRRPPIV